MESENNTCQPVPPSPNVDTFTSLDQCLSQCPANVHRPNNLSATGVNSFPYVGSTVVKSLQQTCYRCVEGTGCMPVANSLPCSMCGVTRQVGSSDQCCYPTDAGCIGAGPQVQTLPSCSSTCPCCSAVRI